ncbi:MAG: Stk1 family PASTA domain-containing Ser/Thr kinase [Lachnospiraceae bacterium]
MILRTGTFLQDRYEILEQIGSGGMSVVYKAKCHKLNRLVAIKVLKEEFATDSNFVSKFKMEAQAAAGLSHPNIVRVYDVIDEETIHYIVMELIEGITLKSYIQKKGKLEVKESIGIAIQVAQGITAAHEQNIIHRDIKPQNMIISRDGKVKVADFGIARAVSAQTLTSSAMGSVHYISPEQARGGYSDARSDIYSLGVTMYEMVTGRLPFDGDNTVAIALSHLSDAMVPPSVYSPEIPISLEQIILKCTEKKPERRFNDAGQVIAQLRKVLLRPEGEFVKVDSSPTAREISSIMDSATIAITNDELNQIKEATNPDLLADLSDRLPARESVLAPKPDRPPANKKKPGHDDDVNKNLERLFASAGIIAAIIIVAVLIVVVSKLTGMFQFSFSSQEPTTVQTSQEQADTPSLNSNEVVVPAVSGLSEEAAVDELKDAGLVVIREYEYFDDVEPGYVASQDPASGTVLSRNEGTVTLKISNGSDKIDLSTLGIETMDASTAKKIIESRELEVEIIQEESDTVKAGYVLRVDPMKVPKGETVVLYVSTGPHIDLVTVPDITGIPEGEAIATLAEVGLVPGNIGTEHSDTVAQGSVISQAGGTDGQIEPGGTINYVVSSGPEQKQQRYVASIHDTYDLSSLIGPGAGSANATLMIRLRQVSEDGTDIYKTLTDTVTIYGSVLLPISYTSIESMNGTDQGEVQVVDVSTGAVLKSYPLAFFPMD